MKEKLQPLVESPQDIIIDRNQEEVEFGHLIEAWVQDKISYETLMRNFPSHGLTIPQRLLRHISDKII